MKNYFVVAEIETDFDRYIDARDIKGPNGHEAAEIFKDELRGEQQINNFHRIIVFDEITYKSPDVPQPIVVIGNKQETDGLVTSEALFKMVK